VQLLTGERTPKRGIDRHRLTGIHIVKESLNFEKSRRDLPANSWSHSAYDYGENLIARFLRKASPSSLGCDFATKSLRSRVNSINNILGYQL
jgi:hypothetical protein